MMTSASSSRGISRRNFPTAGKPTAKIIEEAADVWAFLIRALRME
jgi:prolyl oligopeptidase PreP (S9A serine peptidase family)